MDGSDLYLAQRVLAGLSREGRGQAQIIASRLRLTGTIATLRWLQVGAAKEGRGDLLRKLEEALEVAVGEVDRLDTPTLLSLQDRASRLTDALHVLTRADRSP